MSDDTLAPPVVDGSAHPPHGPVPDLISRISRSPEDEARMRAVWGRVGPAIWQLLYIARNERAQKLATIQNHGSLKARQCKQFIFSADIALGVNAPPDGTEVLVPGARN